MNTLPFHLRNILLGLPQIAVQIGLFFRLFYVRRKVCFAGLYTLVLCTIQFGYALADGRWPGMYASATRILCTVAAMAILPCCFSREGTKKTLIFGVAQMLLLNLSDVVYSSVLSTLLGEDILNELLLGPAARLVSVKLTYALFLFLLSWGFGQLWRRFIDHGEVQWNAPFLLFLLGQTAAVILLDYFIWILTPERPMTLTRLAVLVGLLLASGVLLPCLFSQAKEYYRAPERQRLLEHQLILQKARQEELASGARRVAELREGLRGQLEEARRSLRRQDLSEAGGALDRAAKQLNALRGTFCAHPVVDAVLADKARLCAAEHIRLELALNLPAELPQDGPSLCSLFGNVMDNAIEACRRLPEGERVIRCRAGCRGGYLIVEEENPLPPPLDLAARQLRVRAGRGLGLEILAHIARDHGGELEKKEEDGRFCLTVWLGPETEEDGHG